MVKIVTQDINQSVPRVDERMFVGTVRGQTSSPKARPPHSA